MSLFSTIKKWVVGYRTVRVAVVGGRKSGKTVFLTALTNHIMSHNPKPNEPDGLYIDGWKIVYKSEKSQKLGTHGVKQFEYGATRNSLEVGEWPSKTVEPTMNAMRLTLEKGDKQDDILLEIMDLPGERVADFPMIGKSYEEWCRWMSQTMSGRDAISNAYGKYLERVCQIGIQDENALKGAYKDFLGEEYDNNSMLITPSTIKLDLNGRQRGGWEKGDFRRSIENAVVGINGYEFVPLPDVCFAEGSEWRLLVLKYAKAYKRYQKRVLSSAASWMAGVTKVFYLIDMLSLLESMVIRKENNSSEMSFNGAAVPQATAFAAATLGVLCPQKPDGAFGRFGDWFKKVMWKSSVNTVCVVATKSDLVAKNQRDNLRNLTRRFMGNALNNLDADVKRSVESCAAVRTTEDGEGEKDGKQALRGRLGLNRHEETEWYPCDIPDRMPTADELVKLNPYWHNTFPYFDPNRYCAPRHLQLDSIVKTVFDL